MLTDLLDHWQSTSACAACRAQAIALLLKDSVRLEQERAAFASKRQVYKGFSREQLSNGIVQRTHSADSMEGYPSGTSSYNRQQVNSACPCLSIAHSLPSSIGKLSKSHRGKYVCSLYVDLPYTSMSCWTLSTDTDASLPQGVLSSCKGNMKGTFCPTIGSMLCLLPM